jgi:hypothetical protein
MYDLENAFSPSRLGKTVKFVQNGMNLRIKWKPAFI